MFGDVDATLGALLTSPSAPAEVRGAAVSFETPDRDYAPAQSTVNLFLYGLEENLELRRPAPDVVLTDNGYVRQMPPLQLDCRYLLTAWQTGSAGAAARVTDEHQLLGMAAAWLARFPHVPDDALSGLLVGAANPVPVQVGRHEELRVVDELWAALGTSPRPAVPVVVTVPLSLDLESPEGPPVIDSAVVLDGIATHLVGGTLSAGQTPVPRAPVRLDPGGRTATTDDAGRFSFAGVPAGSYQLSDARPDATASRDVTVPADSDTAYDLAT